MPHGDAASSICNYHNLRFLYPLDAASLCGMTITVRRNPKAAKSVADACLVSYYFVFLRLKYLIPN